MTTEAGERVGACWECGYALRGLVTPRCPECGRGFDPANESTMNMDGRGGRAARWLMRPPGWPMHVVTALAVLMSLWAAAEETGGGVLTQVLEHGWLLPAGDGDLTFKWMSDLSDPRGRFLIGACVWILVGAWWVGRRVARGIAVRHVAKQKAATFAYWRRWLVTPVVFGVTVAVCRSALPVYAGFWLSKPSLEGLAAEARAGRVAPRGAWVGIYPPGKGAVESYNRALGEVWISTSTQNTWFVQSDHDIDSDDVQPRVERESYGNARVRVMTSRWYVVYRERW